MKRQTKSEQSKLTTIQDKEIMDEGAVIAAIAAAIYEVTEGTNDVKSIERTRIYSPWSLKIFGMREPLRR